MIIENLIDATLFPLKSSDTVDFALETLQLAQVSALAVVDEGRMLGFLERSSIENASHKSKITKFINNNPTWIVYEEHYFYEAIKRFSEYNAGCLAVLNSQNIYKGMVTKQSVLKFLAQSYTISAEGSVICIEMIARNYSLNELNRIIENEDSKVLGVNIFNIPDSSRILINLKLNTTYTDRIILSLERFGYEVISSYYNQHDISDIEERYQSLLKYLEF